MKAKEIYVGGRYKAKVGTNKNAIVEVDHIETFYVGYPGREQTRYYVTNIGTGRKTAFRSAAKFRSEVTSQ